MLDMCCLRMLGHPSQMCMFWRAITWWCASWVRVNTHSISQTFKFMKKQFNNLFRGADFRRKSGWKGASIYGCIVYTYMFCEGAPILNLRFWSSNNPHNMTPDHRDHVLPQDFIYVCLCSVDLKCSDTEVDYWLFLRFSCVYLKQHRRSVVKHFR